MVVSPTVVFGGEPAVAVDYEATDYTTIRCGGVYGVGTRAYRVLLILLAASPARMYGSGVG